MKSRLNLKMQELNDAKKTVQELQLAKDEAVFIIPKELKVFHKKVV